MRLMLVGFYVITHCVTAFGQNQDARLLYSKGVDLISTKKFEDALRVFSELLRNDSSQAEYLYRASYLYSKISFSRKSSAERNRGYQLAFYLAAKAIRVDSLSEGAHYSYLVALGRLTEHASNKEKIRNAKLIKNECDWILKRNPSNAGVWHILGRWHREFAALNAIERLVADNLLGGLPEGGSYEEAIRCFQNAHQLEPQNIFHLYELAFSYYKRNHDFRDRIAAKIYLKTALALPEDAADPDQVIYRKMCRDLLEKIH